MNEGSGLAKAMLGLESAVVLDVEKRPGEVMVMVETTRRTARWRSGR